MVIFAFFQHTYLFSLKQKNIDCFFFSLMFSQSFELVNFVIFKNTCAVMWHSIHELPKHHFNFTYIIHVQMLGQNSRVSKSSLKFDFSY